ncbi:MAG: SHOCT domain-containing protein [Burkholderiales bacterium]
MMWDWGAGGWWLTIILFWVLVIVGVVVLVKWLTSGANLGGSPANRALDILKERYARGEITRDQFEQMRRDIES